MLADELDYVVGVDTHRDEHVLAVVQAGGCRGGAASRVRRPRAAIAEALRFAEQLRAGRRVWAIEGAGHYGAGLARYLAEPGETGARDRRTTACRAAGCAARTTRSTRSAQPGRRSRATRSRCRGGQRREALRLLLVARRSAVDVRREALVQLRSVIVTAPEPLREELRLLPPRPAARALQPPSPPARARRRARDTARAAQPRPPDPGGHRRSRRTRTRDPRPRPRARPGAARRARRRADRRRTADRHLVAPRPRPLGSRFARLAGVAPSPPRADRPIRHRLSRGGDRQLNRALHTVILHRRQHDPATKDYIARRVAEGKTRRDATRLLKRYLARHLYRRTRTGARDGLTSHRRFIPERWPRRGHILQAWMRAMLARSSPSAWSSSGLQR